MKEPGEVWEPDLQATTGNGNVYADFTPWDERAEYIRVSLMREIEGYRQDEICLPRMKTSAIFKDVPCGVLYRVHLRSYDAHNMSLMRFYWTVNHTTEVPCVTDVTTSPPPSHAELDLLAVVGITMVTVLLLLTIIFCLWHKRTGIKSSYERYWLRVHGQSIHESCTLNNCDNYVFPIYYIENGAHEEVIHAHIHLLKSRGVNIHTYDELRHHIQADIHAWVEANLEHCTVVLVYHSETLDTLILEDIPPENHNIYGGVCQYSLRQLNMKDKTRKKTVHVTLDVCEEAVSTDVTSLVTEDELGVRLVNLDLVLKRVSNSSHKLLTETETSELQRSVCKLYEMSHVYRKDYNDSTVTLSETGSLLNERDETIDDAHLQGRTV